MKRFLVVTVLLLSCISVSFAQSSLFEAFTSKASKSLLTVSYDYSTKLSGVKTIGSGNLVIQGTSYYHSGSGLDIWCDGKVIWTADTSTKEMVIESLADSESPLVANPTMILVSPDSSFKVVSVTSVEDGSEYYLIPRVSCGVKECRVVISGTFEDPVLKRAALTMDDATVFHMTFANQKFSSDKKEQSFFRPGDLGPSWVVTDLR